MKLFSFFLISISYILAPKFCVYCEHFIPKKGGNNEFGRCKKFPHDWTDNYLITGEKKAEESNYHFCSTARKFDYMCGERGKKYVPLYLDEEDL